ncbi:MAG: endonuclease/exonuclease/phosphatase family protein [Planctomycetaceae bacterium]|jgi:endonuclease/exonuclease/phosphatase family metal-dependent hydrolase|nr:endonuclease/exonuclease/phosphatase family protein [Planctomycetaceae bacterium]
MKTFCFFVFSFCVSFGVYADEPIRILSVNIRNSLAKDGENSWSNRKEFLTEIISGGSYDFVGTQETVADPRPAYDQVGYIVSKMPNYGSLWLSREKTPEKGEAMLILWQKGRWRLDEKDQGTFWLSDTPEVVGSKTDPTAGWTRCVTFGLFHELKDGKETGKKVYVYNTHYDHISDSARQNAAKLLMHRISVRKSSEAPVIVMGDLNCGEKSKAVRYMQGDPLILNGKEIKPPCVLTDTFRAANPDATDVGTFNNFKSAGREKIDYIFIITPLKTVSSKIIRTQRNNRYPTDHFPIEAVVQWQTNN